jgi:YD repeat-containing protein
VVVGQDRGAHVPRQRTGSDESGHDVCCGTASAAQLKNPADIALAADGSLFIADLGNARVRRVGPDSIITTVAGTGDTISSGDEGPATSAAVARPTALATAPDGSLYVADGRTIRQLTTDGRIATIAGGDTTAGCAGDSLPAARACFPSDIVHLLVGPDARLYILEQGTPHMGGGRLRQINTDGIIKTVAGDTTGDCRLDPGNGGPATAAALCPTSFAFAADGSILVADLGDQLRALRPEGTIGQYWHGACDNSSSPVWRPGKGPIQLASREPVALFADDELMDCVHSFVVGPLDSLYLGDEVTFRVRVRAAPLPGYSNQVFQIAATDGSELYEFDPQGRHLATLDALTGTARWSFGYDTLGLLVTLTDADSNVTTVERDSTGTPTAIIGPFGQRTTVALDSTGYLASVTNPEGFATTLKYATGGLLDTLTDARGNVHAFTYDSLGLLVTDADPAGGSLTLARTTDATGYEVSDTTALGRVRRYREDTLAVGGRQSTFRGPDTLVTVTTSAPDGKTTTLTPDSTQTTIKLAADPRFGMQVPIVESLIVRLPSSLHATLTQLRHDSLTSPTDPFSLVSQTDSVSLNGAVTVSTYAAGTRHFVQTSPEGRQLFSTLDVKGRVVSARVADLDSVRFSYDSVGRLIQQQQGGRITSYAYHAANGLLASITDALGRVTHFDYDSAGRVIRQTRPDSAAILFSYDSTGNLTSLTPPGDSTHGFRYTPVGLVKQYDPPGIPGPKPTKYFYNPDRQIDSIVRPDSITIAVTYDSAGRPTAVAFDRGSLTLRYSSGTGNLTKVRTPEGDSLLFTYDGPLPTEVRWAGTVHGKIAVEYDNNFRVISQTLADTDVVSFGYDNDGLLSSAGALVLGRSTTNGLLLADTLGPVRSAYQYTSRGELSGYRVKYDTTNLFAAGYSRDSLGRIVQLFDTTQGTATRWAFVYDSVGRLAKDSINGVVYHAFAYDANGNRTSYTSGAGTANYLYDAQDRVVWGRVGTDTTKYTYGSNGELRTMAVPGIGETKYAYDGLGNLISVLLPDSTMIEYVIDGENRRVGRKVSGRLVRGWLYQDALRPVAELDSSGNLVSRYVYATRANVPDYMEKGGTTYRIVWSCPSFVDG